MAIGKFINDLIRGTQKDATATAQKAGMQGGVAEENRSRKECKMVDLAHEALREEAAKQNQDLRGLVDTGWENVKRDKFKQKVRSKVWQIVGDESVGANVEMVEEITDRIVDVSEADEYYRNMFDNDKA